jgi:hypothetical protein
MIDFYPLTYSTILFLGAALVLLSICYLGMLLRSQRWLDLAINSLPVSQTILGILTLFGGAAGLLVTPDPIELLGRPTMVTPSELTVVAVAMVICSIGDLIPHLLGYWWRVLFTLGTFIAWFLVVVLVMPVLHVRAIFWFAAATSITSGFVLVVMTMFGRRN